MAPFIEFFDIDDGLCDMPLDFMLLCMVDDEVPLEDMEPLPLMPPLLEAPAPEGVLSAPPPPPPPPPWAMAKADPRARQVTRTVFENLDIVILQ